MSSTTTSPVTKASSSPPQQQQAARSTSSSNIQQAQHGEDRLYKTWKTLANCFLVGQQKADRGSSIKELEEYMVLFLRTRVEFGRIVTYLEAKLEGTAQDMEAIQHYHRTMPKVTGMPATNAIENSVNHNIDVTTTSDESGLKRKRDDTDDVLTSSDAKRPAL